MDMSELLEEWVAAKMRPPSWALIDSVEVQYEFTRNTCGGTGYAFVSFRCSPSASLMFNSVASWPASLTSDDIAKIERAVRVAAVDVFAAADYSISSACEVTLLSTRWDEVRSSEMAFYLATKAALTTLVNDRARWKLRSLAL
jgi:hypothetical protein